MNTFSELTLENLSMSHIRLWRQARTVVCDFGDFALTYLWDDIMYWLNNPNLFDSTTLAELFVLTFKPLVGKQEVVCDGGQNYELALAKMVKLVNELLQTKYRIRYVELENSVSLYWGANQLNLLNVELYNLPLSESGFKTWEYITRQGSCWSTKTRPEELSLAQLPEFLKAVHNAVSYRHYVAGWELLALTDDNGITNEWSCPVTYPGWTEFLLELKPSLRPKMATLFDRIVKGLAI